MTGKPTFDPAGDRVAFGSSDGSVRIYDWQAGAELNVRNFDATPTALLQDFQMGPLRWSDGGRTLSAASANGTLHAWTFA
jgi:WD40 repeat protein